MANRLIRVATLDDIPALLVLAERFVSEASFDMAFDKSGAESYLRYVLAHPDIALFVTDDVMAGIMCGVHKDFCDKPVCYVDYMFVSPEQRGNGVSRVLVQAVTQFARLRGCSHVFASTHSAMTAWVNQLFVNLFSRAGFDKSGVILKLEI